MSKVTTSDVKTLVAIVGLAVTTTACVNSDMSDLQAYADQVRSRKGTKVEKLPEIKPYERYLYQSSKKGLRDPFATIFDVQQKDAEKIVVNSAEQQRLYDELHSRNKEELEQFEIDDLRMVGTISREENMWGVVIDPDGIIYRIKSGNYLGRNAGKIMNIFEDRIEVREIISTSQGAWEERQATMALYEQD